MPVGVNRGAGIVACTVQLWFGSNASTMGSSPEAITENQSVATEVDDSTVWAECDRVRVLVGVGVVSRSF